MEALAGRRTDTRATKCSILEGHCGKGSEANKGALTQRAKVGMCPCCVKVTHVLVPATYPVGQVDAAKRKAMELWQKHGPFGSRSYAAGVYSNENGAIPVSWDWIARARNLEIPDPLAPVRHWMTQAAPNDEAASSFGTGLEPAQPKVPAPPPAPEWLSQSPDTRDAPSSSRGGPCPKPPPPVYDHRSRDIGVKESPRESRGPRDAWSSDWRSSWKRGPDWKRRY